MKILFLDDDKMRRGFFESWARAGNHDVYMAKNAAAAVEWLEAQSPFDIAFLDHDLGEEHYGGYCEDHKGTGRDVVDHILRMLWERRPKHVVIHSYNRPGSEAMYNALRGQVVRVSLAAFGPGLKTFL